jgi:hypothetical protein
MSWREVGLRRMLTDWMRDSVRRWHVLTRVVETTVPAFLLLLLPLGCGRALLLAGLLVIAEWFLYEFVLEPHCGAGPYWERGPRTGETFVKW